MKYKEKIKIAKSLILKRESDICYEKNDISILVYSDEEENRIKNILINKNIPLIVKRLWFNPHD